jgi:hypothetical protein
MEEAGGRLGEKALTTEFTEDAERRVEGAVSNKG